MSSAETQTSVLSEKARLALLDRASSEIAVQRSAPLQDRVWWKMMRGLSPRNYAPVTKTFRQAYGIERSAVSERFVQASKEKLHALLERSLADLDLCAMLMARRSRDGKWLP